MNKQDEGIGTQIGALRDTLRILRGKNGCPWDREQTIDDIIAYLIEEAYELLQAERAGNWDEVEEELGDVFFLLVYVHELLAENRDTALAEIVARANIGPVQDDGSP